MGKTTNVVYPNQIALLAFIASITFKVVMLPQYFAGSAGRAAPIAMAYMMAIEVMEFVIIYGVIRRTSLLEAHIPAALKAAFILLISASSYFKTVVLSAEAVSYISTTLFDNGLWRLIVLAYMPCLVYISYKGGNVLARTAQIVFWFIAVSLLFNVLFAHFNGDTGNMLPVQFSAEIMKACDRHMVWFGDFTPFLFLTVARPAKPQKVRLPVMIALCFAAAAGFMVIFITAYGGGSIMVSNAFNKIAVFNRISLLLGTVDFPTVCSWLMMSVIKLALIVYGVVEGLTYFLKKRLAVALLTGLALSLTLFFGITNMDVSYKLATSPIRYAVGAIEYLLPPAVYLAVRIFDKTSVQFDSTKVDVDALREEGKCREGKG